MPGEGTAARSEVKLPAPAASGLRPRQIPTWPSARSHMRSAKTKQPETAAPDFQTEERPGHTCSAEAARRFDLRHQPNLDLAKRRIQAVLPVAKEKGPRQT